MACDPGQGTPAVHNNSDSVLETPTNIYNGAQAWLSDNEFITANNLAYMKPAVIQDKQHYVCSENAIHAVYEKTAITEKFTTCRLITTAKQVMFL